MSTDNFTSELTKRGHSERIKDFNDLLQKIEGVDDKKKLIWREIYENALTDRQNAYVMFIKLANLASDGTASTEYAVHAKTMASFLERMSRSNDQLIKLAELISRSDHADGPIDSDDMFSRISKR